MPQDRFNDIRRTLGQPATTIMSITPDDAADLPEVTTALNVETPGRITITTSDGSTGSLYMIAGSTIAVRARRVWATGTTATGISGLV